MAQINLTLLVTLTLGGGHKCRHTILIQLVNLTLTLTILVKTNQQFYVLFICCTTKNGIIEYLVFTQSFMVQLNESQLF